jgi:hypothetical protein
MMSREELVIWLRDAIAYEAEKPEGEADYEFIDECMALLSELITDEYDLTPEQIANKARKITSSHGTISVKKKPMKMKRLVAIAVAAAVLLCGTIAVFAAPALRQMVMCVLGMEVGERIEQNGITYINSGEGKVYSDIAELIEQEGLDIMYPHKLPDGLEITKVVKFEEEDIINVLFNDPEVSITIRFNIYNANDHLNPDEVIEHNDIKFFIQSREENDTKLYDTYYIDSTQTVLYSIRCADRIILDDIIKNIY